MNKTLVQKRVLESLAMLTIGDGLLAVLQPRRHVLLWESGPRVWRNSIRPFIRNPGLTRLLGVVGLGLGLWLANRQ